MRMSVFRTLSSRQILEEKYNSGAIQEVFRYTVPESYMQAIPTFSTGDCMLHISGEGCLRFKVYINRRQEKIFGGGA